MSLAGVGSTRDRVLVLTLDNVRSRLASLTFDKGTWTRADVPLPGQGAASIPAASDFADVYFVSYEDFLTPSSLWLSSAGAAPEKVKTMPTFFNAAGMQVQQYEATSKDGTKIPYFVVTPKGFKADGTRADAARRLRRLRGPDDADATRARGARPGWSAAACTRWPTSAAAASSARAGTRRR